MQFYVDGFRGGDPDIKNAAPNRRDRAEHAPLPEKVDVLDRWHRACGPVFWPHNWRSFPRSTP